MNKLSVNHTSQFWDNLYNGTRKWSGNPNKPLVDIATSLEAGTALDLGCGEGGDAVWLAKRGWQVTATDVSKIALERTRDLARQHNVLDRINLQQHDFEVSFPKGTYDLVSAQYLQSPLEFQRKKVLQMAARAVSPGGVLIIVEHAAAPSWSDHHNHKFPTADETYRSLDLNDNDWETKVIDSPERETISPAGEVATIKDNVIVVKRIK